MDDVELLMVQRPLGSGCVQDLRIRFADPERRRVGERLHEPSLRVIPARRHQGHVMASGTELASQAVNDRLDSAVRDRWDLEPRWGHESDPENALDSEGGSVGTHHVVHHSISLPGMMSEGQPALRQE